MRLSAPLIALVLVVGLKTTWAQSQPATKAELLQPKTGQVLAGNVDVKLKMPAQLSGPVYARLGGLPWVKLEQLADTNERRGRLNSRMVPNGNHNLIVKTTNKRANTAISVKAKNPLKVYFANMHSHTGYSDGTLLPIVANDYARNVAKLDVYSLTDHLEQVDDIEWLDMREAAWDACEDGEFVAIPGLEWTKKERHLNILDPKTNNWHRNLAGFYKAFDDAKVVCRLNRAGLGISAIFGKMITL